MYQCATRTLSVQERVPWVADGAALGVTPLLLPPLTTGSPLGSWPAASPTNC